MMNSKGKKLRTYNKMILIRDIAKRCKRSQATVRQVYDALEDRIAVLLSSAKPNTDISLRLFEGITISSEHIPEKNKVNNLTGETIVVPSKIKARANITRNYQEKLNENNSKK